MNPLDVKPDNIWNYAQNKPSLIAKDFSEIYGIAPAETLRILMARGVFKWFSVRREIIKLKNKWKEQVSYYNDKVRFDKMVVRCKSKNATYADHYRYGYSRGYLDALTACRKEVRDLCHSERWTAPDFDYKSLMVIHSDGNSLIRGD